MLSAALVRKLCAKNLASARSLFGSKHGSTSNRRRPEAANSEQQHGHCSAAAPTAARSRWGRVLVYATAGTAGVGGCSLAVASGGELTTRFIVHMLQATLMRSADAMPGDAPCRRLSMCLTNALSSASQSIFTRLT